MSDIESLLNNLLTSKKKSSKNKAKTLTQSLKDEAKSRGLLLEKQKSVIGGTVYRYELVYNRGEMVQLCENLREAQDWIMAEEVCQ